MTKRCNVTLKNGKAGRAMKDGVCFKQTRFEEQFSRLLTLSQYMFSILAPNANVEHAFSLMNSQQTKELKKLYVTIVEAMIQGK